MYSKRRRHHSSISVDRLPKEDLNYYYTYSLNLASSSCCPCSVYKEACPPPPYSSSCVSPELFSDVSSSISCSTAVCCRSPSPPPQGFFTTFPPLPGPIPFRSRPLGSIEKVLEYRPLTAPPGSLSSWSGIELRTVEPSIYGPVEYRQLFGMDSSQRVRSSSKKTPSNRCEGSQSGGAGGVSRGRHRHRHSRGHREDDGNNERLLKDFQNEIQAELEEQMKEFRRRRSKSTTSSSKSPSKNRQHQHHHHRRKSSASPPPALGRQRSRSSRHKSKTVPAHRGHTHSHHHGDNKAHPPISSNTAAEQRLVVQDPSLIVTAKSSTSSRAKDIFYGHSSLQQQQQQPSLHPPQSVLPHQSILSGAHRHKCLSESKSTGSKDESSAKYGAYFPPISTPGGSRRKTITSSNYMGHDPEPRKSKSSRSHHKSNSTSSYATSSHVRHTGQHHTHGGGHPEDEDDVLLRQQLEKERRQIQMAQQEKERLQKELEKKEREHRRLLDKERQKGREELERKVEQDQREKERLIEIERKEQELREIINLKQQEEFERLQHEEREKKARSRDHKRESSLEKILEPKEPEGGNTTGKSVVELHAPHASEGAVPKKTKDQMKTELEGILLKAKVENIGSELERVMLEKEMAEKEKAALEMAEKQRKMERERKKMGHRRLKSCDYQLEVDHHRASPVGEKKSRSLDLRKAKSEGGGQNASSASIFKTRTFSYDDELLQINSTFPSMRPKKSKAPTGAIGGSNPDSSPPCTCYDSDSNNQQTVLEMPVAAGTQPPPSAPPPSWLLDPSRRVSSVAQSCQSQGYASLGSSAAAYVEGLTEASEEWAEGPQRHRRSRSGGGYSSIKERHSTRCASFPIQDGDSDYEIQQHIKYCKCSCDHLGYGNYADFDHQHSTSNLMGNGQRDLNGGSRANIRDSMRPISFQEQEFTSSCFDFLRNRFGRFILCTGLKLRRQHWCFLGCILLVSVIIILSLNGLVSSSPTDTSSPEMHREMVASLLKEVPLIDGHNDLPWNIRKFVHNKLDTVNFTHNLKFIEPWSKSKWSHTDISRMIAGKIGCQLWVAYAPCGAQHKDAVQVTLEQIDLIKRLSDQYSQLQLVRTSDELIQAHGEGKIASLITVESGHSIGTSLAVLRMFHRLGARSLTLTHNCNTPWADCSKADIPGTTPEHNGLTQFGRTVVEEMNRLGMIIDLSHSSIQTAQDTLAVSDAPVIFSHSSAQALCNSTRNIPNYLLRLVAEKKGLVMVNFFSYFLTCSNHSTVNDVIAHLSHIRKVAGIDHVGIGASYDGINSTPSGLEDVTKYPSLFASLLATGAWSLEDLKKLAGLNFIRVFREVERVSQEYYKQKPNEVHIPGKDLGNNTQCKTERRK